MKDYQLTIRIPVKAFDDADARQKARSQLDGLKIPKEAGVKLQRLYENKQPERVKI